MPAIDRLLKRWGFVKLSRYGLVLTPEDRIVSLRPSILDDGLRSKVVGWQDDDLAAAELKPWESPVAPTVARLVAQPVAPVAPPSRPTVPIAVAPVALTPVAAAPVAAAAVAAPARPTPAPARPTPAPAAAHPAPAPAVARPAPAPAAQTIDRSGSEPMTEEDEWEWEVALARVRAAADQVDDAVRNPIARAPSPARPAAAAPAAAPAPVPAARPAASSLRPVVGSRPAAERQPSAPRINKTKPIAAVAPVREADERSRHDYSEPTIEVARMQAAERRSMPKAAAVVQLVPSAPEVPQAGAAPAPRRLAKGTSPVTPNRTGSPSVRPRPAHAEEPTVTEFSLSEQTVTQLSYNSDQTTPNLPLSDRTKLGVALPSIRGRLAR